jgi:hypothetical protein
MEWWELIKYPITIRDAQRIVSLNYTYRTYRKVELIREILMSEGLYSDEPLACVLDRLASKFGPKHILIDLGPNGHELKIGGAYRPKGTDEVAPVSDNPSEDSELHGGDGASGETGEPSPLGQPCGDFPNKGTRSASGPGDSSTAAPEGVVQQPSAATPKRALERTPEGPASAGGSGERGETPEKLKVPEKDDAAQNPVETPQEAGEFTGWTEDEPSSNSHQAEEEPGGGKGSPSAKKFARKFPSLGYRRGGTSPYSYGSLDIEVDMGLVREIRQIFQRLAGCGIEDISPRWDTKKLAVRLITKRSTAPARKVDFTRRPAILVAVDTSGSCVGFTDKSLPVAKAIGKLGVPGCSVVVVNHVNGFPEEVEVNGKPVVITDDAIRQKMDEALKFYKKLIKKYRLSVLIALGDADAEWLYKALVPCITFRLIWMDNYGCNYNPAHEEEVFPWLIKDWGMQAAKKTKYITACKDEDDLLRGLKIATKDLA